MRKIPSTGTEDKAVLGQGYDVSEERFAGLCVLGDRQFAGTQEATISFDKKVSETEVADSLGFSVGGKARYGLITGSLSAEFTSSSSSSDYSEVAVYSAKYQFKNQKLNYTGLTPQGQQAKGSAVGNNFVWENWEKTCGHEFVEQVVQGASLYISIKIEFSTKASKTAFDAQFSLSGPMFEVGGKLSTASKQFGKTASISIQAYQLGGDVAKLSQALNANLGDKPEVKAIAVCSMDNPDACLQLLNGAIKYATDEFPKQINPALGADNPAGPADLIYITKPWSDLALYSPPAIIADGVKTAREDLSFQFERNLKYRNRVRALQTGPLRLSPAQQTKIELIDTIVSDNLKLIDETANICYSQMDRCVAKVDECKTLLKSFNEEDFDVHPESIAQWYEIKDLPSTLQEVRRVMNGLEELVKDRVNNWAEIKEEDKGTLIEKILKNEENIVLYSLGISSTEYLTWLLSLPSLTTINLFSNQITDISSLSFLTNLTNINLISNQITDISPLSSLNNLTNIYLNSNQITDIAPLSSLNNLLDVALGINQITDITPLSSLTNLTKIYLHSNQVTDITPLSSLTNLAYIDLSSNQVTDISPLSSLLKLSSLKIASNPIENFKIENSATDFFKNLFFTADKISIVKSYNRIWLVDGLTTYTGVLTRRGKSNVFDAQWSSSDGSTSNEVMVLTGMDLKDLTFRLKLQPPAGFLNYDYAGTLTSDGQQVVLGKVYSFGPGSNPEYDWTAEVIK
jgi:Leucine-rich repeat (LRR) protein